MRKLTLAIVAAAFAAGSLTLPATQASAQDKTVIIKERGHHDGWRHHNWHRHNAKVVVIKKEHHHD